MSESNSPRPVAGPLLDLDDWESAHAPGDPDGLVDVPRLSGERPRGRPRVLSAQPPPPDPRLRPREEAAVPRQDEAGDGHLGGDGVPQHARRRQRPRHRALADRAPDADGRGDPPRRPPALVHPHRPDPRPGQDPLPLRRAAVGGRRRHVPGRLPLLRQDRLPRVLRGQPRLPTCPSTRPRCGIYAEGCGLDQRPPVLGARRVPVPRRQGLPARGSAWR